MRDAGGSPDLLAGEEDLAEGITDRQLIIVDPHVLHRETIAAGPHGGKRIREARAACEQWRGRPSLRHARRRCGRAGGRLLSATRSARTQVRRWGYELPPEGPMVLGPSFDPRLASDGALGSSDAQHSWRSSPSLGDDLIP